MEKELLAVEGSVNYVCWLDLMGAQNIMRRSLAQAARALLKLHDAALRYLIAPTEADEPPVTYISIQPVIDGVYIRTARRWEMEALLRIVMSDLARRFIEETPIHQHLFRAGIAFGPVIDAADPSLSDGLSAWPENAEPLAKSYLSNIAFGMALSQAYESEGMAPPFGVYVHESARAFAAAGDQPFPSVWFHWWKDGEIDLKRQLWTGLQAYYAWARERPLALGYALDRIEAHLARAREYFQDDRTVESSP
jgi:hypothetical protein